MNEKRRRQDELDMARRTTCRILGILNIVGTGIVIGLLIIAAARAVAAEPTWRYVVPARVVRVIDGDTLDADARIWPNVTYRVRIRLEGVNAAEMRRGTDCERIVGRAAKTFVERELKGAQVTLDVAGTDNFGRYVATVVYGGKSLADELLAHGFAVPYEQRKTHEWRCP